MITVAAVVFVVVVVVVIVVLSFKINYKCAALCYSAVTKFINVCYSLRTVIETKFR
jgi:hypothetical protein